ncbi:hypothetical protein BDC45DRAFT_506504 [Circinella umbellata]|nr:hypothetical protein BDC45DRAFT_506504 [Circinella umbellata]
MMIIKHALTFVFLTPFLFGSFIFVCLFFRTVLAAKLIRCVLESVYMNINILMYYIHNTKYLEYSSIIYRYISI